MNQISTPSAAAPALVRPQVRHSVKAEPLTCTIGAELFGVSLADAAHDDDLFAEIRELLLTYKVLFLRGQDISRAEHVAFASRFGPLEDHPVAGGDPENPGLVRIYKDLDSAPEHYENALHTDGTWRENPSMGAVLRCVESPRWAGTPSGSTWPRPTAGCRSTSGRRSGICGPGTASRRRSAR